MTKKTRGKPSKIDLLPDAIKTRLNALLRSKTHTQEQIREAINALIDSHGLPQESKLSRTGLNRYSTRMESIGTKIRQSREVAEAWCAKIGETPTSDVGKLLQEIVRTLAFETSLTASEQEQPVEPKVISQLALAIQRVEQAAMISHKREKELRTAFAQEAVKATDAIVKKAGLSAETAEEIRNKIMGIV